MGDGEVLRVRLLGGLAVDGRTEQELGSRKGRTLLKLLAVARGAPVGVDRLVDVLWGEDPPARPAEQVGVLVSRLRAVLGARCVARVDAGYRLQPDWLDVDELARRVQEASTAMADGRVGAARAAAAAAVALARGELLPEEEGVWVEPARAAAAADVARARHVAAMAAAAAGDHAGAAAAAEAALLHDPYDEVALRALMRSHGAAGRPASALAAYVRVRERLVADLGVDPTPETEALHDELVIGAASGAAPQPVVVPLGFVGRTEQLARLDALLGDVAATGDAALVVVRGEPGIGKSAMVAAWCAVVAGRAVVLRGRCDELGRDLPLQPVADAISAHLGALGPEESATLLGDEAGVVADVLGWSRDQPPAPSLADPELGRARLFGALVAVLARIGEAGPVVLTVEDLHLAGASTLGWLAFARRRAHGLLLVATSRPGGPDLPEADLLDLPALDRDVAAELVGSAGSGNFDELYRRAGGNPLFLLALASSAGEDLPRSVHEAARIHAASLGPAEAAVRAAAVLGEQIDLDLLAEVLGRPAVEVLADLEAAAAVGLLDERGAGLVFRHELVREALDRGAGSTRRAFVHRAAARALVARPAHDPLAVAVHARLGGDVELAVTAYQLAAGEAFARFDTDAALSHLDAAIGLGGSASAFVARARVRMATLDLEPATADAAEAIARGGGAAALEIAAWVAYYRRRYDEASSLAEQAVALAADDEALRTSCLAVAGRVRHGAGDLQGAAQRLEAATGGPPAVRGVADVWLAHLRVHEGQPGQALSILERPLLDAEHLAHPWAGLHGRFARVMALGYLGRPAEALSACDALDAAVRRRGVVGERFVGAAANVRAWLLRHCGAPGEADEQNRRALEFASGPHGGPRSEAFAEYHYVALLDLADGHLLSGDLAGAAGLVERLAPVDTWSGTMSWHQRHRLGLIRARLALGAGQGATASALAAAVVEDASARGARRYALLGRAWFALADGQVGLDHVAELIDGLDTCAALEGWRLSVALADRYRVDAWRAQAERRAAALITAAGPLADRLRAAVAVALA